MQRNFTHVGPKSWTLSRMRPLAILLFFAAWEACSAVLPPPRLIDRLNFKDGDDEVVSMPGFTGTFPSKHYGGYLFVGHERWKHMYYYLVMSESSPKTDPLVLWLNGGPGCSSFDGWFYEHGPFTFSSEGIPTLNKNSWSKAASILYVDSPIGVGFSYSTNTSDYVTTDTQTSIDLHHLLLHFFQIRHPELAALPFFIAGESYAGVYVPMLAQQVHIGNKHATGSAKINLKGYMVGNGVTDPVFDGNAIVPFARGKTLIDDKLFHRLEVTCGGSYWNVTKGSACDEAMKIMDFELKALNIYNVLEACFHPPGTKTRPEAPLPSLTVGRAWPLRSVVQKGPVQNWAQIADQNGLGNWDIPCMDDTAAVAFLNRPEVRAAIHAEDVQTAGKWELCSRRIHYTHDVPSMLPIHRDLVQAGYRALIFSGDHDMCVPHTGSEAWVDSMGPPEGPLGIREAWRPWMVNEQVAGYVKSYADTRSVTDKGTLSFATVKGAGHTVPEYKPEEALHMFRSFINDRFL